MGISTLSGLPNRKTLQDCQAATEEQGPGKLRKPFQQVQHNCNKLFSNTCCH